AFVLLSYDGVNWSKAVANIDLSGYISKTDIGYVPGKNMIDKEQIVAARYEEDGSTTVTNSYLSTPKLAVTAGEVYTLSGHGPLNPVRSRVFFFDGSGTFLSSLAHEGTDDFTFTVPAGAATVGVNIVLEASIGLNPTDNIYSNAVQLEAGSQATSYEPYSPQAVAILGAPIRNAEKDIYSKTEVDNLLPEYTFDDVVGKNIANPARIINGLVSSAEDNGIISNPDWRVILISVDEGETYTISGWDTARTEIAFYSGDITDPGINPETTNLISSGNAPSQGLVKSAGKMTFVAPATCTFFAITIRNNVEADTVYANLQVEKGEEATTYEPFTSTTAIEKINNNKLIAGFINVSGDIISADQLAAKDGSMTVELFPDGSSNSSITYKIGGKTIRQELAPFRPLSQ